MTRFRLPIGTNLRERWRFRNRLPTNHPRTSYQTRLFGTRSLRWFYADGLFSSASDTVIVQFLAVYAVVLGATDADVGLIAIANGLAGILALGPGAWIAERTGSRRWVVLLTGGGIGRLMIIGMALAPVLVRHPHDAVYLLVALTFVRCFAGSVAHPSWMSLLVDIIPLDLRRFYVAQRMLGFTVVATLVAPLAGVAIRLLGGVHGFQWAFLGAFGVGAVSTLCYSRIAEPRRPARADRAPGSTRAMLGDHIFMRYMAGTLVLQTTTMFIAPFLSAYMVRDLGATTTEIGALGSVDGAAAVIGQLALGLVVTRVAPDRLMRLTMLCMPIIPLAWLIPREPWQAALPSLLGGSGWAIYNVVAFNLLMEYAPRGNIPRYAATQQMTLLAASFIGPVIGTAIVASWGIRTAMVVSAFGRFAAAGVMVLPVRPAPAPEPERSRE